MEVKYSTLEYEIKNYVVFFFKISFKMVEYNIYLFFLMI